MYIYIHTHKCVMMIYVYVHIYIQIHLFDGILCGAIIPQGFPWGRPIPKS